MMIHLAKSALAPLYALISLSSCYLLTPRVSFSPGCSESIEPQPGMFLLWPPSEKAPWQKKNTITDNESPPAKGGEVVFDIL